MTRNTARDLSCGSAVLAIVIVGVLSAPAAASPFDGTSPATAAISAKQIRDDYPASPSGTYWFDPDQTGAIAPFQAFADQTVFGGGWSLAINSVTGSEPPTSDIVSTTGTFGLSTGYTRAFGPLAVAAMAEIRHQITFAGGAKFDAKYTGMFHDPLPAFGSWTTLPGHTSGTEVHLAPNFSQPWQTSTSFGAPWYTPGGGMIGVLPSTPFNGLTGGPFSSGLGVTQYQVWVRELVTPLHVIPEPSSFVLAALGLIGLTALGWRRRKGR